jgi:aspartyl-tRNA(Asn)/glutamyl-tRNA(Gln) amidotransferase subunit B
MTPAQIEGARQQLGELPQAKRRRLVDTLSIKAYDAEVIVSQGKAVAHFFEALVAAGAPPKRAASWMQQDILRTLKEQAIAIQQFPLSPLQLAELLRVIEAGQLDTTRGRDVFQEWLTTPQASIASIIQKLGIVAVASDEIEALCRDLLAANPDVVEKVRAGNAKALGSLVGQAKKKNPNADPRQVQDRCLAMIQAGQV